MSDQVGRFPNLFVLLGYPISSEVLLFCSWPTPSHSLQHGGSAPLHGLGMDKLGTERRLIQVDSEIDRRIATHTSSIRGFEKGN